ncbi:MAG: TolC family protein [Planctomycetota bacterium]|jgi:outer membrane protein TolC
MARGFVYLTAWTALLASGCQGGSGAAPFTPPPVKARAAAPVRAAPAHAPPARADLPSSPTLSDYLACAALNSPELKAAFHRWKAELETVPQARALPDPNFTYRYFIEEIETRVGPQRHAYRLSQTLPWFGKLALRGDAASEAARARRQQYEAVKVKLFQRVKDAYYDYSFLQRAIEVTRGNMDLLKQLEAVARGRYRVGAAGHPDVIRAQVELGRLSDRLAALREVRVPIVARLNAAMGRPVSAPLPWPARIVEEKTAFTDEQVLACAAEYNPELKALSARISERRRRIDLARKDYFPDLTVGTEYIDTGDSISGRRPDDDGDDPIIALFSINVPLWWDKYAAGVREARFRHLAAVKDRQDRSDTLMAETKLALYEFHDGGRKIDLYRDTLVPKAQQSYKAVLAAYRAGKAQFDALMDAERILLDFQLSHERALADRAKALARLETLVGRELPRAGGPKVR